MAKPVIVIGSDHRGFHLKNELVKELRAKGYEVDDQGDSQFNPEDDYPVYATKVVNQMKSLGDSAYGVLLCGSGQGMAMTANRHKGIRAVVAWDKSQARLARNDDDSNVLALPADIFEKNVEGAVSIVETFLSTPFESIPRRIRRIEKMDNL
jgi:ribose 5-phosphate isomerase B